MEYTEALWKSLPSGPGGRTRSSFSKEGVMDKRWALPLGIAGVVILIAMVVPGVLGSIYGWGDGFPWMMGWGFGWMWFMPVFMIVFWGLVIWAVVALVQGISRSGSAGGASREDSALEILKRRYARGEIGKEEYEEKKRDLL
jgi:putative membrane protein